MMNDVNNKCVFDYDAFEVGESLIDHRKCSKCREKMRDILWHMCKCIIDPSSLYLTIYSFFLLM